MDFGYGNPQMGGYNSGGMTNIPTQNNVQFGYPQPQAYQNQQQTMVGRIVPDINVVTPQEVPMNGGIGIFPIQDGSCIYIKTWNGKGGIQTDRYIKEDISPDEKGESELSIVMGRLDKIERMLSSKYHRNPKQNTQKKAGNGDEKSDV